MQFIHLIANPTGGRWPVAGDVILQYDSMSDAALP